jgi:hypothetical protein
MVQKMALHGTNGAIPPKGLKLLGSFGFHVSFYGCTNGTIPPNATKDGLSDPEIPISDPASSDRCFFVPTGLCESESWPEGF